ncbi:hypothetical protein Emag_004212 [Eimeria magna]
MACLPSTLSQFRDQVYWDHFFKERKGAPFEWYGSLKDFRDALASLNLLGGPASGSSQGPLVLHVGCGNSCLPKELYDEGWVSRIYKRIVNVDFSPVVIEEMKARYSQFPSLEWRCLDVRGRGLQEAFLLPPGAAPPFDVILDKGFLDAYLSIDHEEAVLSEGGPQDIPQGGPPGAPFPQEQGQADGACSKSKPYDYRKAAAEYFEAVLEVLKEGGSFVLVSLAQDYVLKEFVSTWCLSIFSKPSCTMAGTPGRGGPETFPLWELTKRVAAVSRWQALDALACSQSPGKRVVLHVGGGCGTFGRCCVAVYDSTNQAHAIKAQTAALLVPPGQELTWTFASPEGNQQVADQLEAARLLVVTFPIGFGSEETQDFPPLQWRKTIEEAQKTLGPLLKEFALPNNDLIPILTLGEQAPVREVLWQQGSPLAGRILVRDVRDTSANAEASAAAADGGTGGPGVAKAKKKTQKAILARKEKDKDYQRLLRQLIFSCNSNTTQSEIKVGLHASMQYRFRQMLRMQSVGNKPFAFSSKVVGAPWGATSGIDAVLLGLGGGVLGSLLHHLFGHVGLSLTCVELDPIVIDIAKKVVNAEGKQYVSSLPVESVDLIILDLNSGEKGDVLICPPKAFAEADFLEMAKQKLRPGGLLVTNLLCRCTDTKTKLLDTIKSHFAALSVFHVPEDVNEVAVAVKEGGASPQSNQPAVTGSELLRRLQHLERCFLQHTGGKGGWLVGQTAKAWAAQMKPWPLPKSSGKNGR